MNGLGGMTGGEPPVVLVEQLCNHYACRCARAAELLVIYDRTGDGRDLNEAIAVHSRYVRCREEFWRPRP